MLETILRLEVLAGIPSTNDPDGDILRASLRSELDSLNLPSLTVPTLKAICIALSRSTNGKSKGELVKTVRRHVLERIEILFSAVS